MVMSEGGGKFWWRNKVAVTLTVVRERKRLHCISVSARCTVAATATNLYKKQLRKLESFIFIPRPEDGCYS